MPRYNYNIDDILNEYSGEEKETAPKSPSPKKPSAAERVGDTAVFKAIDPRSGSVQTVTDDTMVFKTGTIIKKAESVTSENMQDTGYINIPKDLGSSGGLGSTMTYNAGNVRAAAALKKPSPSHATGKFAVSDVERPNVSFISSVKEVNKNTPDLPPRPTDSISGYDGAVMTNSAADDEAYIPKVRRMSDSTRAKEMRKRRKKKGGIDFTYERETPDGVYIRPEKKNKKFVVQRSKEEGFPEKANEAVDFSENRESASLDVRITPNPEEKGTKRKNIETSPREKDHSIKDYDSFEDAGEIKRDIAELKGSMSFRIFVLIILTLVSVYITVGEIFSIPVPSMLSSEFSPRIFSVVQAVIGVFAIIISIGTFKNGLLNFIKFNSDSDSIASIAAVASVAAAVCGALEPELVSGGKIKLYMPVAAACLLVNAIGKYLILKRAMLNFDFVSKSRSCNAVVIAEDDARAESLARGTIGDFPILAAMRKTNFITDFSKYTYSTDSGDRLCRFITPILISVSALASVLIAFVMFGDLKRQAICFAVSVFAMIISASCCMAMPLIANIPLVKAAEKYVRNHGVILGYQSVEDFYDVNSMLLDVNKLFPTGTVNLMSIKLFSDTKIDEAIITAASLTNYANSVLKELFNDILAEKQKMLSKVENYSYEESLGICGWINNRRILFGNRDLMMSHKIEGIPTKTKENEFTEGGKDALYLSVSGNLAAMFVIEVTASPAVRKCMARLERNDIAVILKSVDPFITINRLSELFGYPEDLLKILPQQMIKDFDHETRRTKKLSASMACSGKFTSLVSLLLGTKSIKKTITVGGVLQTASVLLGVGMVGLHCILKAFWDIDPVMVLGYNLICTLVTCIFVKMRKV